ncbi:MAG: lipocalin-like domain-containing protein [Xenococcus sp. MO_188.B8]|nr:lipocalin-like domain-containing protein [Xenococcus sp. MO_188.B8]
MKKLSILAFLLVFAAGIIFALWPQPQVTATGKATVAWLESQPSESENSFSRVYEPQEILFPRDLGPHEDYQTEWWYYTGNLETTSGRPLGFQLTIFRRALTPAIEAIGSDSFSNWRSNQVYFAHFTISDVAKQSFYTKERFSRGAMGLAGAQASPYQVWLEDWSATELAPGQVQLVAKTDEVALDLTLQETLPPILQGDRGYSVKGEEPGNASIYYSIVQQPTTGTITVGDETFAVTGLTWKDHEYSTSSLSPGTVGWDWFSLQFDQGTALMLYVLRKEDGTIAPSSGGTFISADGSVQPLKSQDWQLQVLDTWKSPTSKGEYPSKWQLSIPQLDLTLTGKSLMANQELNLSTTYWEGAVEFQGQQQEKPVQAKGYVEMTGYTQGLDTVL